MELSTYISSFREVNSIYAKFIETGLYGFDEQEIVINFFEEIKDIKKLEKVLFESSEALNFQSKFNAFKIVLNDNIKLYEENKELFNTLDVDKLCGIKSSFFNQDAFTTTIPAQFVKKFKCKVVPIYIERIKDVNFQLTIHEPLVYSDNETVESITLSLNNILEKLILKNPGQWIWSHNRWK